jgi:beta-lactamase superfamily II metal-dependent hydrolase
MKRIIMKNGIRKKIYAGVVALALAIGISVPVSKYIDNNKSSDKLDVIVDNGYLSTYDEEDVLQVHFIDVGQGDSILVVQNNEAMLIDAGENEKGREVVDYCEKQGISEIKYLVATHAHEDHIGGMDDVIENLEVDNIILTKSDYSTITYEEVITAAKEKNVNEIYPKVGNSINLGNATIMVVAPNRDDYSEENNNSIILKITYGNVSYLFCGDAEIESEYDMAENGIDISADVIKIGHHGSDTSTSQMLLNTVSPRYAVISVGKDNSYGHPTSQILNRLKEYGIKYFRTDEEGTIVSITDGENIAWNVKETNELDTSDKSDATNELDTTGESETKNELDTSDICEYVLNNNTKKFHKPQCNVVDDISDKNRENYSGDRDSLIEKGYAPCKICNP